MKHIAVTGGSGKLGRAVIRELLEHGYQVTSIDQTPPDVRNCRYIRAELTDAGEAYGALKGTDALIHLAAIPALNGFTHGHIFKNNVLSTYYMLEAAEALGMRRAVIGSSESAYGFFWATHPFLPHYFPVDEQHPLLPQETYGASKQLNELTAAMFYRNSGIRIFPLRFALIIGEQEWPRIVETMRRDPAHFRRNFYSYVDARDAAAACRLALEADGGEPEPLNITHDETLSELETKELLAKYFPEVQEIRGELPGYSALFSNKRAKEKLGWQPVHSWRSFAAKEQTGG
jgi:nucleoside-diphosphate-sugar epimerase